MGYKCSKCGYASEQPGNCPTCNVPMNEEVSDEKISETAQPQEPASSEEQK